MKINRNNYELYFVDYLDGNLSDGEIHMLEDFLLINPDLRTELEGTEKISLSPDNIDYNLKEFLKKPDITLPVEENNFEDFCIAGAEGDLNEKQLNELINYKNTHPEKEGIFELYKYLHLTADKAIVYPEKGKLKKAVLYVPREILFPVLSVAAGVAFMLIIYLRNEDIRKSMPGAAAAFPSAIIATPDTGKLQLNREKTDLKNYKPEINQAAIIALSSPKEKKQAPTIKKNISPEKSDEDQKSKDLLPPQRLNPSFQIKLPSIADNQIYVPTIDGGKIMYSTIKTNPKQEEYLSLSEYARKQLTEKVLGIKERENTRLSVWQVADAGISGINKLTGGDMKLEKRTSHDGTIAAYSFDSKLLSFSTTAVNKR